MKNKIRHSEKGFALPLSLLLLVVMTIMGVTLVTISSNEHNANNDKDTNQQVFYAAESGIAVAKKYMVDNTSLITGSSQRNLDGDLRFCKASFFPNLRTSNGITLGRKSLSEVISATGDEANRLAKYKISVKRIIQTPDKKNKKATIVIITHKTTEINARSCLSIFKKNKNILKFPTLIRLYN